MVAWAGNTLNAHSVSVVGQFDQQAAGMIADLSIGVRDLERSKGFYDSALAPLGYRCLRPGRTMLGYGYGFLYRVPEIVTLGRLPGEGESDSRWRTKEVRHVGSDTLTPGF